MVTEVLPWTLLRVGAVRFVATDVKKAQVWNKKRK